MAFALAGRKLRAGGIAPGTPADHVVLSGVPIFDGDLGAAVAAILAAVREGRGARVATANLDFFARARRDGRLRADLAASTLVVADGAPVAWAARFAGAANVRRVTGVDLVAEVCRVGAPGGLRLAFYGSTEPVARTAAGAIERTHPGVSVVRVVCPPFRALSEAEIAADVESLAGARPDVVLVALGCPRQERFIAEHFGAIPGAAWIGVGGTFDFYAGKRKRAPGFAQRLGMEWVVRLAQEPRRLWRRYLVDDLPAAARLAMAVARARVEGSPRPASL